MTLKRINMSLVPYSNSNSDAVNLPSSYQYARNDDFFGYGNPMQAINAMTPQIRQSAGGYQQPTQIITTVSSGGGSAGGVPIESLLASSGGTFFDLRSPDEIFADMDSRLSRQRLSILNSAELQRMLQKK